LLPAGFEPATSEPPKRTALSRSNRHLHHHRVAAHDCASTNEKVHRGTVEIGVSTIENAGLALGRTEPTTHPSCRTDSTVRSIEGGFFTRSCSAKYPKSSPPAFVAPRDAANQMEKQIQSRRSQRRAAIANLLVRSAIGVRLAPRSLRQAPRFGRAHACASPGIRVSRSGFRREL
jgi:hypothetical protein